MSLSPYNSMGNNPISFSDPEGDLFFVIPQISFSGGFSLGVEVGIGFKGGLSLSASGGYNFGSNSGYWSGQASLAGFSAGYGSNGAFAGFGKNGIGIGVGYGKNGFSGNIGLSSDFGKGYSGSLGLSYGSGGLGFNTGVSSAYMWGNVSPGATAESGEGELQGGGDRVVGNTGLYEDETLAYNVMVEQTQSTGIETAAWLTDKGVLVSPIEFPGEDKNTPTGSSNGYYKVTVSGKKWHAHHNGQKFSIRGQIHTHPSVDQGLSKADHRLVDFIKGRHVYTIGPKIVHRGYNTSGRYHMNIYGLTSQLLNGKLKP